MCLQHGLVVPRAAYDLVLAVEARGIVLTLEGDDVIAAGRDLRPEDIQALRQWKPHVRLLLAYVADDRHLFDPALPCRDHGPFVVTRRPS